MFERFNTDTGEDVIWSMKLDGSDQRRLTAGTGAGATDPNVSPDGKALSFVGFNELVDSEGLGAPLHR